MFEADTDMARKSASQKPVMEQLNIRVPPDLVQLLQAAHRVETLLAQAGHADVPDYSASIRRFLRIGIDATLNKVNGLPKTEADWAALEASILDKH